MQDNNNNNKAISSDPPIESSKLKSSTWTTNADYVTPSQAKQFFVELTTRGDKKASPRRRRLRCGNYRSAPLLSPLPPPPVSPPRSSSPSPQVAHRRNQQSTKKQQQQQLFANKSDNTNNTVNIVVY